MGKRKALVGISLILFLVVLNVFLYAQPSLEELTGRIESLEEALRELTKSSTEKDDVIGFLREQQSNVYENANHAIRSVDSTVGALSLVVIIAAGLIGIAGPISIGNLRMEFDEKLNSIRTELEKKKTSSLGSIDKAKTMAIEEIKVIGKGQKIAQGGSEVRNEVRTEGEGQKTARGESFARIEVQTEVKGIKGDQAHEAVVLKKEQAETYCQIARCLRGIGDLVDARLFAQKAIGIDPSYSYAYGVLAEISSDLGDEFFEYLEKALQKGYPLPELIKQHEEIRELYLRYKDVEEFKESLKKYKIVLPNDFWK